MTIQYTPTHNLPYPQGSDSVLPATRDLRDLAVNTDSALSAVKTAATEDAITEAVAQTAWYKGSASLGAGDHVDGLARGVFTVWGGAMATTLGFPVGISSLIEVFPVGSLVAQRVTTVSPDPQRWERLRLSSGWQPWRRTDIGAVVIPDPEPGGAPATGLRVASVALTTSTGSGTETRAAQAVRIPLHYAPPVRRWRVHVANHNAVLDTSGNAVTLTGLWVGPGWNGTFTTAPTQVSTGGTVPAGGGEWVSKWINTPIGSGQQMMLSAGLSGATGTNIITPGGCWRNTSGGAESTAGATSGSGYTTSLWAPLNWWIEAEIDTTVPVIAGWGDSNTAGTGTTLPVNDSWLSQHARAVGAIPMHVAFPGTAMSQWASGTDRRWERFTGFRADAVIHFMGQNDIAGTSSLAEMQARYNDTIEHLKAKVSPNLYLATITPSGGKTSAQNTVRRQYETWLRGLPGGARDLFEFGAAISTNDTTIAAPYDSGDQLHFNTNGHAALAAAIARPVVTPSQWAA